MPLAFIMAPRLLLVGGEFGDKKNEFIFIVRNVLPVIFFGQGLREIMSLDELTFLELSYFFHTGQKV